MSEQRSGPAVTRLDEWMCEEHSLFPMGHHGCLGAGVPSYEYTGWAVVTGWRGGRAWLIARRLISVEFSRLAYLVHALDHDGNRWTITYEDWGVNAL